MEDIAEILEDGTVLFFTEDNVEKLKDYASRYLPYTVSEDNFLVIKYAASKILYLQSMFLNFDVILCPGDSPSRYIKALELTAVDLTGVNIIKFPISGLGNPSLTSEERTMLKDYIAQILGKASQGNVKIAIFDYVDSGYTTNKIIQAIKDNNQNIPVSIIKVPTVGPKEFRRHSRFVTNKLEQGPYDDLYDIGKIDKSLRAKHYDVMIDGNAANSRCIPSYKISQFNEPIPIIDITNCKIISTLVALAYYNML